jgi:hypothetical protein
VPYLNACISTSALSRGLGLAICCAGFAVSEMTSRLSRDNVIIIESRHNACRTFGRPNLLHLLQQPDPGCVLRTSGKAQFRLSSRARDAPNFSFGRAVVRDVSMMLAHPEKHVASIQKPPDQAVPSARSMAEGAGSDCLQTKGRTLPDGTIEQPKSHFYRARQTEQGWLTATPIGASP